MFGGWNSQLFNAIQRHHQLRIKLPNCYETLDKICSILLQFSRRGGGIKTRVKNILSLRFW
jgi:hypothetical protein